MKSPIISHLLVLLATFLVGGSFIVSQKLSGIVNPISLNLLRFVYASIFLAPFIVFKKEYRVRIIPSFQRAMIISFFYSLFFIGLFKSLEYTTALNTGTIFTLVPLLTAIFSIFAFKQSISIKQFIVYFVGIVGTIVVVFKGNLELLLNLSLNKGDILFSFAVISMALYSISGKYLYRENDKLIVLVFMTLTGGCIWMGAALVALDIPLGWGKIENEFFWYMTYLSLLATLLTSYLYHRAIVNIGPKKVMAYVYLNPAAIALLLFAFEGVIIPLWSAIGIIISSITTKILLTMQD